MSDHGGVRCPRELDPLYLPALRQFRARWFERTAEERLGKGSKIKNRWRWIIMNDPCPYCGRKPTTIDHIIPRFHGGRDYWSNMIGACKRCNHAKGSRRLLSFVSGIRFGGTLTEPVSAPPLTATLAEIAV